MIKLFLMAFTQTCLVACNIIFLVNGHMFMGLLTSLGTAWTWTNNVQKIAFGHLKERMMYCLGAMTGTFIGYYLAEYLQEIIK